MDLEYYVPEDFASDESFVNYCLQSDPADTTFWEQWLIDHPERKQIADQAREWVYKTCIRATPEEKQTGWEKISNSLSETRVIKKSFQKSPLNIFSKKGAILSVVLAVGVMVVVFYWMASLSASGIRNAEKPLQQYVTSAGQRYKIILADGTQVWLNADSKLNCNQDFNNGKERVVTLSGEAYFKVAHNPGKPFVIHTQKLNIKVLGTEFNVEAYPDENKEVASLINGSIRVSLRVDPEKEIILKPHEKVTVLNNNFLTPNAGLAKRKNEVPENNNLVVAPLETNPLLDSSTVETAWMEGKLVFINETFSQLSQQMERWYNVQIHFANDSLKNYRFTGIFSTETIDEALQALKLTSPSDPFEYHIEGKEVFITQDKRQK